jgi:citrate lyase subunit beta/citryl-CoA lyase
LLQAEAIATSSPRLDSLIFGVADFAGEVGARDFKENQQQVFSYARQHLLTAARAAGLDAIDSVTVQFKDLSQVEADARHAAMLGYDGKWAIHPAQLPAIHAAFTPSDDELARAQRLIDAYASADATAGLGAIVIDGEMVDAATLMVEKRKLAIAQKIAR